MLIRRPPDIPSSEIADESLYWSRREFLQAAGIGMAAVGGFIPLTTGDWPAPGDSLLDRLRLA